ncbi:MAG: indole-3-glycerol-phosphate synthase [Candidatus Peribacteraceae bacterium]|nr:indole-3-glycerol-phosphate synthase [Candidatus Peribacteraceae bacterium]
MSILSKILEAKRKEVSDMPEISDDFICNRKSFIEALRSEKPAFIAEIKPKSPSVGNILSSEAIPEIVKTYNDSATAISVLCDEKFFGGGFDLLLQVSAQTDKPLLAKEFVISEKQVMQAVINGASAILLIAAILEMTDLIKLIRKASSVNLSILLELHSVDDIEKASSAMKELAKEERQRIVFGINNRNLDSLNISLETTAQLAPKVKSIITDNNLLISESGIKSAEDIHKLSTFVDGFLIGTSILQSSDFKSFFSSLKTACNQK